jgi:hypothetical protein
MRVAAATINWQIGVRLSDVKLLRLQPHPKDVVDAFVVSFKEFSQRLQRGLRQDINVSSFAKIWRSPHRGFVLKRETGGVVWRPEFAVGPECRHPHHQLTLI